jgi:hypothetical protein
MIERREVFPQEGLLRPAGFTASAKQWHTTRRSVGWVEWSEPHQRLAEL